MIGWDSSGALRNEIAVPILWMMHWILAIYALDYRLYRHLITRFVVVDMYL
jgi:hypothetical protein